MRNNNQKHGISMMWMMLGCIVLFAVLFFIGGSLSFGGILWPILIGIFVAGHIGMMLKGYGRHEKHGDANMENKPDAILEKQADTKDEHKHGGCCH